MFVLRIAASMFFAFIIFTFLVRFFIFVSHTQCQITHEFVKYIPKINHFRPSNLLFTSVFLPFCGGKNAIGGTFLVLREPNSTNHFAKNHFFSLPLFRPDNAIFHNIDNISIFCKILKICKICGY